MKLSRRSFLATSTAASVLASFKTLAAISGERILVSAASDKQGQHWAFCLNENGELISQLKLPARAHEVLKHPLKSEIAIIGRRPGQYVMITSIKSGRILHHLQAKPGYHFYGHAIYSADGRFLITTENHIESGQGHIFVRDAHNNYQVHTHFPSYGIGPHEIKLCKDQSTLVVANGGILTHPAQGRKKLNLDTMSPSLAYVSLKNGERLEQAKLAEDLHQLSIRHIDINNNDEVLIGMQYQGDRTDNVPLVASHKRGETLKPLWAPHEINYAMKQYCGSVCFDPSGKTAAISSPKGDLITFWNYEQQAFHSSIRCKDACGLASYQNQRFLISNGLGKFYHYNMSDKTLLATQPNLKFRVSWDNHLTVS